MKKLKIFLLLSILLCFGFALSSEVQAQSNGPKLFEVGDVLPATTQLRISWNEDFSLISDFYVKIETPFFSHPSSTPLVFCEIDHYDIFLCYITFNYDGSLITVYNIDNGYISPYTNPSGGHNYCDIDISTISEADRTVSSITGGSQTTFYWQDLNASTEPSNAKPFEVGDELPATNQLRISWTGDITNLRFKGIRTDNGNRELIYTDSSNSVYINTNMDNDVLNYEMWVKIYDGNESKFVEPYTNYNGSHAYIDIDTFTWPISFRTIQAMDSVMDIFTWEDLNPSSSEDYPKVLKEGDELPAGYIKISWDFTGKPLSDGDTFFISGDYLDIEIDQFDLPYNGYYIELDINDETFIGDTPGYTIISLTEPSTIHSFGGPIGRLEDYYEYIHGAIFWEVVSPEYLGGYDNVYDGEQLEIEEGYILPESIIGINLLFNNTGGSKSGTVTYTFGTYGQIIFTAQEDNLSRQVTSAEITFNFLHPTSWEDLIMIDDTLANQSFGSTRGILFAGILLDFSLVPVEERTITDITVEGDLELDIIFTRILTEEEIAYQEGYSAGYQTAREIFGWKDGDDWYNGIDAWNLGEKYARELYGFYDSTTDEWLSVSDYVARYGTGNGNGSTGASDFYKNFDKYFIPAMIIVFGGAIVLTILKVFKGRE